MSILFFRESLNCMSYKLFSNLTIQTKRDSTLLLRTTAFLSIIFNPLQYNRAYTMPCAIIALATFKKPATLAPRT